MEKLYKECLKEDSNGKKIYGINSYAIIFIMYTGLRISECISLKWEDINEELNIITISHSIIVLKDRDRKDGKTKYLTKERDKAKEDNSKVLCEICNEVIPFKEYDRHYSRCLSVEYLDKNYFILNNNHLDKNSLRKLSQEEFDKKYYAFLV